MLRQDALARPFDIELESGQKVVDVPFVHQVESEDDGAFLAGGMRIGRPAARYARGSGPWAEPAVQRENQYRERSERVAPSPLRSLRVLCVLCENLSHGRGFPQRTLRTRRGAAMKRSIAS